MSEGADAPNFGPYQLLSREAVGGMAEVFKARYRGPGGPEGVARGSLVAIKRMLPETQGDEDIEAMLESEARLAPRLTHPNVARVYGLGRLPDSDEPYLVMEYVRGHDLHAAFRCLERTGDGASAPVVAAVGLQAASALDHVHGLTDEEGTPLGVVHRDVSPQNLRLQPSGTLKLLDFGIARFVGRTTETLVGVLKGKHAYMSPEQVNERPLDGRSDLFALGVILYEMATGARLFLADSVPETLLRVRQAEVAPLCEVAPDFDPALSEIIMACLHREPAARPARASDLARSLSQWLDGHVGRPAREILASWTAALLAPADHGDDVDEIGDYRRQLRSAEEAGEETTDKLDVADATRVFDASGVLTAPPTPRAPASRRLRVAIACAAALGAIAWAALSL